MVVFDEAQVTPAGTENGTLDATIAQHPYPYGYDAGGILTELNNSGKVSLQIVDCGAIEILCEAIRKENLAKFRNNLANRLGKTIASKVSE